MMKKNRKKQSQSNFSKLSIFQPNKFKFKKKCPLSGKGAPSIDYKNVKAKTGAYENILQIMED